MKKIILCAFLFSVCGFYPAIAASILPDSDLDGGFAGGDSDLEAEITPNPGTGVVGSCTAYATGQSCTLTNCDTCINYQYTTPAGFHNNFLSCAKCVSGYTMDSYSVDNACLNLKANRCTKNQSATCANCSCTDTITSPQTGYKKIVSRYCNPNNNCICTDRSTTYSCASGYYQSGNTVKCDSTCRGCTKCPENYDTCSGTTFTCKDGYYESGSACQKCPANSTCNTTGFTCNSGYYESGGACQECPANSTCDTTGFTCNSGYYESGSACKKCPDNSTCESDTNFTCKDGYYKSGGACQKCPDNSTCSGATFTCNQNYYRHNNACVSCGTIKIDKGDNQTEITMVTDAAGAKNKSACHLPDDVANTTYNTKYNGHNVTVRLTGSCSKN